MDEEMLTAKEQAMARLQDPGDEHLNCAQTVMHCALLMMGRDTELTALGGYMGGGMSRMGQVCGAVSGACLAMGLRDQLLGLENRRAWESNLGRMQAFIRAFEAEFRGVSCAELLGIAANSPEAFEEAKRRGDQTSCSEYVAWACDHLDSLLDD